MTGIDRDRCQTVTRGKAFHMEPENREHTSHNADLRLVYLIPQLYLGPKVSLVQLFHKMSSAGIR